MSTIFVTPINYREQSPEMETPVGESLTQPDQVMSIREMLTRHVRGLPVPNAAEQGMFYDEDLGYIPSRDELDLADIDDYRQHYAQVVERLSREEANQKASSKVQKSAEGDKPQKSDGPDASEGKVEPTDES